MRRAVFLGLLLGAIILVGVGVVRYVPAPTLMAPLDKLSPIRTWISSGIEDFYALQSDLQSSGGSTVVKAASDPGSNTNDSDTKAGAALDAVGKGANSDNNASEQHEEGQTVKLSRDQLRDYSIEVAVADEGPIAQEIMRPAEVKFDGDRLTHVLPRVSGIATEVLVTQGQDVKKGQLLAKLSSRELAELKATYLANFERRQLARETFDRESRLWEKKVSSEKDYLETKSALAEADIALRASAQKMRALGFSQADIDGLKNSDVADLTEYEILSPSDGTIIQRHINLGEAVSTNEEAFIVADASSVWVDVTIYPNDMAAVTTGQRIQVSLGHGSPIEGKIAFVTPNVSEETRTAVARAIIKVTDGRLKPGMFTTATIDVGEERARVRLPKAAIQTNSAGPIVFVRDGDVFEPRAVRVGRDNANYVEIVSGLKEGESYVSQGAFTIKSLIQKSQMGEGH